MGIRDTRNAEFFPRAGHSGNRIVTADRITILFAEGLGGGARREYTYTFPRTGQAYRIDHALASPSLLPRIRDCRYSHRERDDGVSDHSLLLVEIED
jgi:hypothetical protein